MTRKNRYANRARISTGQVRQLVRFFVLDLTASQIALLTGVNRNTVNRYVHALRERIALVCEAQSPFRGEVEVDASYVGARRVKGKRGRGAYGKTIVFGIFQRNGQVYTELVPDCRKPTLQAIIRGKVAVDSMIYSDGWRGYNGLVDVGYGWHLRVDHSNDEFVRGRAQVNGIEDFGAMPKPGSSVFVDQQRYLLLASQRM